MTVERTPPEQLSPRQRAAEVAALLAAAIARIHAARREALCARENEIPLGFPATKRLHTTPSQPGVLP